VARSTSVFTGNRSAVLAAPRVPAWATVVAQLLRPGGWLFIREGHPMLWALAERSDDLLVVGCPLLRAEEPTVSDDQGTYVKPT